MNFKETKFRDFWESGKVHPKLEVVARYFDSMLQDEFNTVGVVTSLYRDGDTGVHGTLPCRGIDFRANIFDMKTAKIVADRINSRFVYDVDRANLLVCLLHGEGANIHFHLQVHGTNTWI